MRTINVVELSNFKVLPYDLYSENKMKILSAGEILTPGKLIMLKNYMSIYTEDVPNNGALEENEENSLESSIKKPFKDFSYDTIDASDFDTVINKNVSFPIETYVKIKYFYKKILDLMNAGYYQDALLKLNDLVAILRNIVVQSKNKSNTKGSQIRFMGEYELCHPLNVSMISGLIAQKLDYSIMTIDQVMLSALLHDSGKLLLPKKQSIYSINEDEVKEHTHLGFKLLKEELELPDNIALVALEHHENNDGSGYPKGLSSDYISEFSQIINVANYYDNLAFNRTHIQVSSNKDALRAMLEVGTKKFSAQMLFSFIHMFNYDDSDDFNDMSI